MKKITVVVPIYNVEKYVRICFDSLLRQTFKDFVVMAVNDGSPANEQVIIDEYAENNHVSVSWFIRNFKHCTGVTPMQYILSKRIYNAEILLQDPTYNVTEIARIVGYDNPLYFSRIFKKAKGLSPSEYRKSIKL